MSVTDAISQWGWWIIPVGILCFLAAARIGWLLMGPLARRLHR